MTVVFMPIDVLESRTNGDTREESAELKIVDERGHLLEFSIYLIVAKLVIMFMSVYIVAC